LGLGVARADCAQRQDQPCSATGAKDKAFLALVEKRQPQPVAIEGARGREVGDQENRENREVTQHAARLRAVGYPASLDGAACSLSMALISAISATVWSSEERVRASSSRV